MKKKETLAQLFSCEFREISKNIFYYRASPVAASDYMSMPTPKEKNDEINTKREKFSLLSKDYAELKIHVISYCRVKNTLVIFFHFNIYREALFFK